MKIKFLEDVTLSIVEGYDEGTDTIIGDTEDEMFHAGEVIDVEFFSESDDYTGIQFGDGSVALGVQRSLFEIVHSLEFKGL